MFKGRHWPVRISLFACVVVSVVTSRYPGAASFEVLNCQRDELVGKMNQEVSAQYDINFGQCISGDICEDKLSAVTAIKLSVARDDGGNHISPDIFFQVESHLVHPVKISARRIKQSGGVEAL